MIFGLAFRDVLAWFLFAFFFVGAVRNWIGPTNVRNDYIRWGYPDWFHRVTAVLELLTSILLALASTRLWGVALGAGVMLAAIATLLRHNEYKHAMLPTTVLLVLVLTGVLNW